MPKWLEKVEGYTKKVFRGRPLGGEELKGTVKEPTVVTLKTRKKTLDEKIREQGG